MIHYELLLLFASGLSCKTIINGLGYPAGTTYRWHRIYRDAAKHAENAICRKIPIAPRERKKTNNLDDLKRKKRVTRDENKAKAFIRLEDGRYVEF
jgi:hypothetical protein